MFREETKARMAKIYEILYLVSLAVVTFCSFLNTTMIPFRFTMDMMIWVVGAIAVVVVFGLAVQAIPWKNPVFVCSVVIFASFVMSWRETHHRFLLELGLLIIGACGISFKKIMYTYLGVSLPFFIIMFVFSLIGIIPNLIYFRGNNVQNRMSFGSIYPTDFCAHVFFLACCWVWARYKKVTYFEVICIFVLGVLCMVFCDARTALVCMSGLAVLTGGIKAFGFFEESAGTPRFTWIRKTLGGLLLAGTIVPCIVSIGMSWFYNGSIPWMKKLNYLFSDRLRICRVGLDRYPVKAFGQIVKMNGNGGNVTYISDYFFLDSSYMYILLCLGWATLLAVMVLLAGAAWREWKCRRMLMLAILCLVCVQCFMEHHLITIGYHPFLLLFTAGMAEERLKKE